MLFFLIVLYPLQVQVARQISTSVLAIHVDTVERVKTEWMDLPATVYLDSQVVFSTDDLLQYTHTHLTALCPGQPG